MNNPDETFVKKIVKEAGERALEQFRNTDVIGYKTPKQVVTEADVEIEEYLKTKIEEMYPDHSFIAEESGESARAKEGVWIIDPIDGTSNFVNDIPIFAVMVGFAWQQEMEMSCIYFPYFDECFFASKDEGAYLNNKRIECSDQTKIPNSDGLMSGYMNKSDYKTIYSLIRKSDDKSFCLNSYTCSGAELSYVACGRKDWVVVPNHTVWDVAPGALICKEAGCEVSFIDGEPYDIFEEKTILVANESLRKKLVSKIR